MGREKEKKERKKEGGGQRDSELACYIRHAGKHHLHCKWTAVESLVEVCHHCWPVSLHELDCIFVRLCWRHINHLVIAGAFEGKLVVPIDTDQKCSRQHK